MSFIDVLLEFLGTAEKYKVNTPVQLNNGKRVRILKRMKYFDKFDAEAYEVSLLDAVPEVRFRIYDSDISHTI